MKRGVFLHGTLGNGSAVCLINSAMKFLLYFFMSPEMLRMHLSFSMSSGFLRHWKFIATIE